MRQFVRSGKVAMFVVALAWASAAVAQVAAPGQTKGTAPATKPATLPARPAILDQVLATVNGESITRADVIRVLQTNPITPGEEPNLYKTVVEMIANSHLVSQYLAKQNLPVGQKEVEQEWTGLEQMLKKEGQDIRVALAQAGMTEAELRKQMLDKLRFRKYMNTVATDAALQKYVADNKDLFNRTQVKASHILLRFEPDASAAVKEAIRQKLVGIKRDIDGNKISFADAANKFSEDDGNKTSPNGGDLGYFTRNQLNEQFSAAAFALKKGSISEPIETPFGYHLIQVTDRREGTPIDFEQNKVAIQSRYANEMQDRIVAEMRKTAKIDIKPLPADLFPKQPAAGASTPAKAAAPGGTAGTPK